MSLALELRYKLVCPMNNFLIIFSSVFLFLCLLNLFDIILVESCYSNSSYAKTQNNSNDKILYSTKELNDKIKEAALKEGVELKECRVASTEAFYNETEIPSEMVLNHECMAAEMESFALFQNARYLNKKAACLLTISDNIVTGESTSSEEREKNLNQMIKIALETI